MKPRPVLILLLLLLFPFLNLTAETPEKATGRSRTFEFTYNFTVKDLPATARRVRVWIPLASSDRNQKVVVRKISSPVATHVTRTALGDRILYAEIHQPKQTTATFSVVYKVTRREYSKGDFTELMRYNNDPDHPPVTLARFLRPDRLIPIDGKLKALSDENTHGKQGTVEKAHALYDYVFKTMRYDKSGTGWGRGDAVWACDAKHGNCTDFHSVFIAMARAAGIPAKFEIGFPLPEDVRAGLIPGYHCWAEFYVDGPGWVPVDISEAWKNPAKHDYFFGTLDANRVQFSVGRDLILSPKQDGPPVNYFVYPYVEVDGRPYQALQDKFAFRELNVAGSMAADSRSGATHGASR